MPADSLLSAKSKTRCRSGIRLQQNGLVEQCMAMGECCFEDREFLVCNSLEDPDHLFILQRHLGDFGHLLIDCYFERIDKT